MKNIIIGYIIMNELNQYLCFDKRDFVYYWSPYFKEVKIFSDIEECNKFLQESNELNKKQTIIGDNIISIQPPRLLEQACKHKISVSTKNKFECKLKVCKLEANLLSEKNYNIYYEDIKK